MPRLRVRRSQDGPSLGWEKPYCEVVNFSVSSKGLQTKES